MVTILYTLLVLCAIGVVAAVVLYFVASKFYVYEDPRIDSVEAMLPGVNCGGCGMAGCRAFAVSLVESEDISPLYCPVGGSETMSSVAGFLGKSAAEKKPEVAVIRCGGSCDKREKINQYDGLRSCVTEHLLYGGETKCNWGCLALGDCVGSCQFDAITIDLERGLAVIDEEKCTACGACTKVCPKMLIELRPKGVKGRRIYVGCSSKDKGALSRKACGASCIACTKCKKVCGFEAITIENNLAYIDASKCRLCRKCTTECPTGAIMEVNFPPKKVVVEQNENV